MGTNYTPSTVSSGFASTTNINNERQNVKDALDRSLSRYGDAPNQMEADFDVNSNRIINVGAPSSATDAVRLQDITSDSIPLSFDADNVSIEDSGGYYSGTDVEAALQEIGSDISAIDTAERVGTYTELKALTAGVDDQVYVRGRSSVDDGGHGVFVWVSGDQSSSVTNDPQEGIYVPPDSDTTGASGVWKRLHISVVNVKWFGAVGDGVVDDSSAIQSAIDAVSVDGGLVYIPAGNYLLSSTITIERGDIDVVGSGRGTWIRNGTTNSPAILIGDGVTRYFHINIRDLRIGQESGITPVAGNAGLKANMVGQSVFENIYVSEFPSAVYEGIVFEDVSQSVFNVLRVQGCLDDGVIFFNCLDVQLADSRSDGNGNVGFAFQDCEGVYARSCSAAVRNEVAWHLRTSGGVNPQRNMWFDTCIGDESNNHNWIIERVNVGRFTDCWGSWQKGGTGGDPTASGFVIQGSDVTDVRFDGCIALDNNRDGFLILNGGGIPSRVTFSGCLAGSDYWPGVPNGQHGINIAYGNDIAVVNCRARGNGAYGINLGGNADLTNILVAENFLQGNTSGAVQSAGPNGLVLRDNYGYVTYNYGNSSIAPDANGEGSIAHGCDATPIYANANLRGDNVNGVDVVSIDATNITVRIKNASGADVTTGTFTVDWEARV